MPETMITDARYLAAMFGDLQNAWNINPYAEDKDCRAKIRQILMKDLLEE